MSKYNKLWNYINTIKTSALKLTFSEISDIAKIPLDHSFLRFKEELDEYGWHVSKISIKNQTVIFEKIIDSEGK